MCSKELQLCRICLCSVGDMYCIFDASDSQEIAVAGIPVLNLLKIFTDIIVECNKGQHFYHSVESSVNNISSEDGFPNKICRKCLNRINDFYCLKCQCEMSESRLKIFKELGRMPPPETVLACNENFSSVFVTYVKKSTRLIGSEQRASYLKRRQCKNKINEDSGSANLKQHKVNSISSSSNKRLKIEGLNVAAIQNTMKDSESKDANPNISVQIDRGNVDPNVSKEIFAEREINDANMTETVSRPRLRIGSENHSEEHSKTSKLPLNQNQDKANDYSETGDNGCVNPKETDKGVSFRSLHSSQKVPNIEQICKLRGIQVMPEIIDNDPEDLLEELDVNRIQSYEMTVNKSATIIDARYLLQKNQQNVQVGTEMGRTIEMEHKNITKRSLPRNSRKKRHSDYLEESTFTNNRSEMIKLKDTDPYDLPKTKDKNGKESSDADANGTSKENNKQVLDQIESGTILAKSNINNATVIASDLQQRRNRQAYDSEDNLSIFHIQQEKHATETEIKVEPAWINNQGCENPENAASNTKVVTSVEQNVQSEPETVDEIIHFCSNCYLTCRGLNGLKDHIIYYHTQETFCIICNKNIDSDMGEHCLLQHMPSVTDIELAESQSSSPTIFKCAFCNKSFWTREMLNTHTKIIHGKYNSLAVPRLKHNSRARPRLPHKEIRTAVKSEFPCEICSEIFSSELKLLEHYENFHNETKPLNCPICTKTFKLCNELTTHVKKCILTSR